MQVACKKLPVWQYMTCKFVLVTSKSAQKGAKVHKKATLRQKLHFVEPKTAGVAVHDMQNHAVATHSGYFTSVASEMGPKSGGFQNLSPKSVRRPKCAKKLH